MVDQYYFTGLYFVDAFTHAHYVLYNQAYLAVLNFVVRQSSAKTVKIRSLEYFLLYGS